MPGTDSEQITDRVAARDTDALSVSDAQRFILEHTHALSDTETLPLKQALGRVLSADLISPINVPATDNSAMDGYALRSTDLNGQTAVTLKIIGRAFAGHRFEGAVPAGSCVRIMTGAAIPEGCDCVLPQEMADQASDKQVTLPALLAHAGDNLRRAGEDLTQGQPALIKGRILTAADLGLIASLGRDEISVMRKLRVAYFSTGDELRSAGQPLGEDGVYDSNRYTLHGMLVRAGFEPIDLGVVPDDPHSIEAALRQACEQADAVIISGGISAGDADYTRQMMARLGNIHFWKIAMRPGRPMAFGELLSNGRRALLFGLPGNPVAVMISFYFFARPSLHKLAGAISPQLPLIRAISTTAIRKKSGRTEYQRGVLRHSPDGQLSVQITGAQGSGILSSMSEANCMIVLEHDQSSVPAGASVDVLMFDGLI